MKQRLALTLFAISGMLGATQALAQAPVSAAPVGGTSGAVSRPGWSAGQATSSEFSQMGRPMTRSEAIRRRSAAAQVQGATGQPRQPPRRRSSAGR
ncbi:hypothetical protein J8J14_10390 [Roseomonas sp. SSH11]|uniref:Uncharacterized protein n=1 Tax=Pararoseomonas baculiformis TaxID=2820812 RepID=A0ABS4ADW9_9PROT|nr:hypothetical protein [Pararoseomonas baculiformis]MBP0445188.1 hypothetical protein [Pararoseomonas baculiformis]